MPALTGATVKLSDLGEGGLVRKIRDRFNDPTLAVGIGDDAAVFDIPAGYSAVFCSDLIAENTHFLRDLHPPESVGYKAVAVNVSDVGAMGGIPMHFLISLAAPGDLALDWIDGFFNGVEKACGRFGVSLVGGDSSASGTIFVDVSMIGRVRQNCAVRRSGAQPGDGIYVTGTLGSSALGLERLLAGDVKHPSVARHLYPEPRHRIGYAVAGRAHAMIDVSDGLSTDLNHIVEESNVSARIYRNLLPAAPEAADGHVLHGGEEYELVITAPDLPGVIDGVPVTRIGEIVESTTANQVFLVEGAQVSVLHPRGWQHFGNAPG
jgi:thiamine-monophosphate kinase